MAPVKRAAKKSGTRAERKKRDRVGVWFALGGGAFLLCSIVVLIYCLARDGEAPGQTDQTNRSEATQTESTGAFAQGSAPPTSVPAASVPAAPGRIVPGAAAQAESAAKPAALESIGPASSAPATAKAGLPSDASVALAKPGPPGVAGVAAKNLAFLYPDQAVNRAIDRGVAYLKQTDDFRIGAKALAGLTLISCGVPATDPAVLRAAAAVRADAAKLSATYELALCVLFLDCLGEKQDETLLRHIALQMIAGQSFQGGWNYHCFPLKPAQEKKLLALLQAPFRRAAAGQVFTLKTVSEWQTPLMKLGMVTPADLRYLPVLQFRPGQLMPFQLSRRHEDNSLTQFAVLALWTARRHGIPVERSLAMVEARLRSSQNPDGSWGYRWGPGAWGQKFRGDSMTCAGLLGLAAGQGTGQPPPGGPGADAAPAGKPPPAAKPALKADAKKAAPPVDMTPAIEAALLFVSQRIGAVPLGAQAAAEQIKANARIIELQRQLRLAVPAQRLAILQQLKQLIASGHDPRARGTIVGADSRGDLYYLWSLERVGVIYDLRTIAGKDWYAWGAPLIVAAQQPDGSWNDLYPGVPDTCFALLFLRRTNMARDLTLALQRLRLSPQVAIRMTDMPYSSSPGQQMGLAMPKEPPLRSR